jgi:hypothetical protein
VIRSAAVASFFALAITAQGQQRSTEEGSGWYGIMFTSVGAFPAFEGSGRGDGRAQLAVLGSTWKYPSSDVSQNGVGLAFRPRSTETIRYDLTVGWSRPSGSSSSDEATLIGGASAIGPLWWSTANERSAIGLDWSGLEAESRWRQIKREWRIRILVRRRPGAVAVDSPEQQLHALGLRERGLWRRRSG